MADQTQTPPPPNRRVLIVEDEPKLRAMLLRALPDMGFVPTGAASGEDALLSMNNEPASIAVLDLNLPGINGLTVFERLREQWPDTQVVFMSGYVDLKAVQQAIRSNVADFLAKPFSLGDMEHALDRAWRRRLGGMDKPRPPSDPPGL